MNNQNKHYQQLTQEPRFQISGLRKAGMSLRSIAQEVGVHFSTVSRELRRNATDAGYIPQVAHQLSDSRRRTAQKAHRRADKTDTVISESLAPGWSPGTISERLKLETQPPDQLSHSTIYRRIEDDRQQGGMLYCRLPRFLKKRWESGKRNKKAGVELISDRVDITERPPVVDDRTRIGDWGGVTQYMDRMHTWQHS